MPGMNFIYSNNTALTDPTAGKLKFDSLTLASVTSFRISDTDNDANDITAALRTGTAKTWFMIQKTSDAGTFIIIQVNGTRVSHTTWEEFPVKVISQVGVFTDGDAFSVIQTNRAATSALASVIQGPAGRNAGLAYKYSTDVADTDPGAGFLKFDNLTLASITSLKISNTDGDSNPIAALLATLDTSTSTTRSILIVQKDGAPGNVIVFAVNAARTDNSGWKHFPITFLASNGSFAANDIVKVFFALTGAGGGGTPQILWDVPGDPTGTASPSQVMMGLAESFTPAGSGKVMITICGNCANSAIDGGILSIQQGTGSAPTNGAGLAGSGITADMQVDTPTAGVQVPFSLTSVLALTVGVAVWFDLAISAIATGTFSVHNLTINIAEL
jgi:hypothetical protein